MLLIGHRGCKYPGYNQNTIRAFEKVTAEGVTAIEFDVQLSADNQLVIAHNLNLGEISTGTGDVRSTDSATLRKLFAGDPKQGEDPIPFLEDVFDFFSGQNKENRPAIHMELKANNTGIKAGELFLEYVNDGKLEISDMLCSSFNWSELQAFRSVCPTAEIALLEGAIRRSPLLEKVGRNAESKFNDVFFYGNEEYMLPRFIELDKNINLLEQTYSEPDIRQILGDEIEACLSGAYYTTELLETARDMKATSVNLWFRSVSPEFVEEAHKFGVELFVYTANDQQDIENLAAMGVDGIFTDYYLDALRYLTESGELK